MTATASPIVKSTQMSFEDFLNLEGRYGYGNGAAVAMLAESGERSGVAGPVCAVPGTTVERHGSGRVLRDPFVMRKWRIIS